MTWTKSEIGTEDIHVLQCNYREGDSVCTKGARAYVLEISTPDRVYLVSKSRSGRWVRRWAAVKKLCDFRVRTMPSEHPMRKFGLRRVEWIPDVVLRNLQSQ